MASKTTSRTKRRSALLAAALLASSALAGSLATTVPAYAAWGQNGIDRQEVASFADLVAHTKPAVVSVIVRKSAAGETADQELPQGLEKFFKQFKTPGNRGEQFELPQGAKPQDRNKEVTGQGSGFFITADGYIVTNDHVVDGADRIMVRMNDGKELKAKLIGTDKKTDLAVIKVQGNDFPHVAFGKSAKTRVGDWVVAVGNPFGLGGTTTAGIVSARGRDIGSGPYDDFIQIDAPINRGNSGGPTFNLEGQVIGVNTAIYSPSGGSVGIGFAIPSDVAEPVVASLIKHGSVSRGWLGVSIQRMTKDLADSVGLKSEKGALVASVSKDSPAGKAGVKAGDVVLSVDGKPIASSRELSWLIANKAPGSKVILKLWRDDAPTSTSVKLGTMPGPKMAAATPDAQMQNAKLGLLLQDTEEGVRVANVTPGSPADDQGVQSGDFIRRVQGKKVTSAKQVIEALSHAPTKTKGRVLLLIDGPAGSRFVALNAGKSVG